MRRAGVGVVYLVHGTFVGEDLGGLLTELGRFFPGARDSLAAIARRLLESTLADRGLYTTEYVRRLSKTLNADGEPPIEVRLFGWTGENHHLGRADAAVRLLDELATLDDADGNPRAPEGRVLLWGHSHGGNVFAILTHLLSGDSAAVDDFFHAARWHYRIPWFGSCDLPVWERAHERLRGGSPIVRRPLDFVTFGTPLRYGWHPAGFAKLLHFVNHRPLDPNDRLRAVAPSSVNDVLQAAGGDYIQQFGIAGTNLPPNLLLWRAWLSDRRLGALLQPPELTMLNAWERIKLGRRVPQAGQTLLVDYGPESTNIADHWAGHAVYTRNAWMAFHVAETARALYDA